MNKTDSVRLQHMIDAARKAIEFSQNCDRATLDQDEMRTLAIVRVDLDVIWGIVSRELPRLLTQFEFILSTLEP